MCRQHVEYHFLNQCQILLVEKLLEILHQSRFAEKLLTNPNGDEDWEKYRLPFAAWLKYGKMRMPSPLDVYRSLFTADIINDGTKDFVRIHTKEGDILQKPISASPSAWHHNTTSDDKEDVAIMIASTMFAEEILMEYLTRQPIQNYQANIKSVSVVKQRDGIMALRIMMNDGMSMMIPMDSQDESCYRRLSPNDTQHFLNNLAVHYLTREDSRSIIQRIRQNTQTQLGNGNRPLPHPQNFTPPIATAFSLNFANVLSYFNVDTERGENREWEVGNRSRYDDLDTLQSSTQLSM